MMTRELFCCALIVAGLTVCAHAKPMDARAGENVGELRRIAVSIRNGALLSQTERAFIAQCIDTGDPVLLSASAWIIGEAGGEEEALLSKLKATQAGRLDDMSAAFIRIALEKREARSRGAQWLPSRELREDPNPYLRIEDARELLARNQEEGMAALRQMGTDERPLVRLAAAGLSLDGAALLDERYRMVLSIIQTSGEKPHVEKGDSLAVRNLLSEQQTEREQALKGLSAGYSEVSAALLKTLAEANAQFRTDRRYHSPLHCAILAVDAWQVTRADGSLLEMVDYELDIASLPDGIKMADYEFYPAAMTLVRLRVDVAKVERALEAAEDTKTLRILTWVLLKREGDDIEKAKRDLGDARSKSHGADERRRISKALGLLDKPSQLLPLPWTDHP
jgi:hypothetical protein